MKGVRIAGIGSTAVGKLGKPVTQLATEAVDLALHDARMSKKDLQGLVAVPSLSEPHFMQATFLATEMKLLPSTKMVVRTIDTGGAGPISALITGAQMIRQEWADAVVIVAADAVSSLDSTEFAKRADASVAGSHTLPSPSIPNGYDRIARWHMKKYGVTREHLAMVPTILSHFSSKHPHSLCKRPYKLEEVLNSAPVGEVTSTWECARRADGAAAVVLASERHLKRNFSDRELRLCPSYVSGGEASGPMYPPELEDINEDLFSCEKAARIAYRQAHLSSRDIDFWGLYDCFPICFLRALEAVQLCERGKAGEFIEKKYKMLLRGELGADDFPINTHGGLQCFGAPWEVPAMYNILEAVRQLRGEAGDLLQVHPKPRKALVYGNGGIFSASSVAILSDGIYH